MTDRLDALTIILDRPIRDDDAEPTIGAIKMIKGVKRVIPHIEDVNYHIAEAHLKSKLQRQLRDVLD